MFVIENSPLDIPSEFSKSCMELGLMQVEDTALLWFYVSTKIFHSKTIETGFVIVRNKFHNLQEISERHTLNHNYENFVTAYMEAAALYILIKLRAKCRIP